MDRTLKMRAYSGDVKQEAAKDNLTREQALTLELATKSAQLEDEKKKSLEQLKTIEQLRQALTQEQARTAESTKNTAFLESRIKELYDALDQISRIASLKKAV